jgi:undecaprenyl diphosphate synthase
VDAVKEVVRACGERKVTALTLFAFSSENWQRPESEVGPLMDLFMNALQQETDKLHSNQVKLRVIGDRQAFTPRLQACIAEVEQLTHDNQGLQVNIAANYGGRWDIARAAQRIGVQVQRGTLSPAAIDESVVAENLSLAGVPPPDLFIRTGGERRISNYLLWDLAYTELYFTDCLWPDFGPEQLHEAVVWYGTRQRRFGRTGEQLEQTEHAERRA